MTTSLNGYHATVCRWLGALGIQYVEEYPVGPYSLDIYIPDLKLAVEIDGPYHSRQKDEARDAIVQTVYNIKTVRVKVGTPKQKALEDILYGSLQEFSDD